MFEKFSKRHIGSYSGKYTLKPAMSLPLNLGPQAHLLLWAIFMQLDFIEHPLVCNCNTNFVIFSSLDFNF